MNYLTHSLCKLIRVNTSISRNAIKSSGIQKFCSTTDSGDDKKSASTETKKRGPPELAEKKWQEEFHQKEKGKIAGKLPYKIQLKKGKTYKWCSCGHSKHQPFCDGSHRHSQFRTTMKPMTFKAPDDVVVWLCTCKQSNNRPFCDGAHRSKEIQELIRV